VPSAVAALASSGVGLAEQARRQRAERRAVMDLFGRYVSRSVAQELWRQRAEFMEGGRPRPQRLVITAMLTDLKGYTRVAESMDAEALMDWVNEYMDAMTQVVEQHGGIVDDYTGDGIKANFGVPIASGSPEGVAKDAQTAVRCALEMGRVLETLAVAWRARGLPTVSMRVGLYTGVAVGGSLGSADRMKYTTVGDTVNTAARLESFHKDDVERPSPDGTMPLYRVLVGDSTREHLDEEEFELEDLGIHAMRGRAEAIGVHRVWGFRKETT
jgi:adenylate cyclase